MSSNVKFRPTSHVIDTVYILFVFQVHHYVPIAPVTATCTRKYSGAVRM